MSGRGKSGRGRASGGDSRVTTCGFKDRPVYARNSGFLDSINRACSEFQKSRGLSPKVSSHVIHHPEP